MFGQAARAATRPAAAAAAAVAVANAAQGPAQARCPPPQGSTRAVAHPQVHSKIFDRDTDGWVMAEVQDEVVLFQPFDAREVDEAATTLMAMWGRPAQHGSTAVPLVAEQDEESDDALGGSSTRSSVTDGALADAIIEATAAAGGADAAMQAGWRQESEQMKTLMAITTRMLRRPGMQREVVACMLEDSEVRDLMLRQCNNLDHYLLAAGIHPDPQLLPPGSSVVITDAADGMTRAVAAAPTGPGAVRPSGGPNLMGRLVGAVAGALERAGDALAALGSWFRRYVATFKPEAEVEEEEAVAQEGVEGQAAPGGQRPARSVDQVLGGIMVLAVAVFCVMVIKKPLVVRALSRR